MAITIFVSLVILAAFMLGEGPERGGGLLLAIMAPLYTVDHFSQGTVHFLALSLCTWQTIIGFGGFLALALSAWRIWPIWAAALQLLAAAAAILSHFHLIVSPQMLCGMQDMALVAGAGIVFLGTVVVKTTKSRSDDTGAWRRWLDQHAN